MFNNNTNKIAETVRQIMAGESVEESVNEATELNEAKIDKVLDLLVGAIDKNASKPEFQKASQAYEDWANAFGKSRKRLLERGPKAFWMDIEEALDIRLDDGLIDFSVESVNEARDTQNLTRGIGSRIVKGMNSLIKDLELLNKQYPKHKRDWNDVIGSIENARADFTALVQDIAGEDIQEEKGDKEAYQKFFNDTLKKYGVKSPSELKGDDEKKFYDEIDAGWKGDDEKTEKNESNTPKQPNRTWFKLMYSQSPEEALKAFKSQVSKATKDQLLKLRGNKKELARAKNKISSPRDLQVIEIEKELQARKFNLSLNRESTEVNESKVGKLTKDKKKKKNLAFDDEEDEPRVKKALRGESVELEEGKIDLKKKVKNEKEFESYMDSFKGPDILAAVEKLDSGEKHQKGTVGFFLSQQMSMKEGTVRLDARRREFREKIKKLAYAKAKKMIQDEEELEEGVFSNFIKHSIRKFIHKLSPEGRAAKAEKIAAAKEKLLNDYQRIKSAQERIKAASAALDSIKTVVKDKAHLASVEKELQSDFEDIDDELEEKNNN